MSAATDALEAALTDAQDELQKVHARWDDTILAGQKAQGYVEDAQAAVNELEQAIEALTLTKENRMREANGLDPLTVLQTNGPMIAREVGPEQELDPVEHERMVAGVYIRKNAGA